MTILLVEDSSAKREDIKRFLTTPSYPWNTCQIREADSYISAMKMLKEHAFDLLILDLVLPFRSGEAPDIRSGEKILISLHHDGNKPTYIICITADAEAARQTSPEVERNLGSTLVYDSTSAWEGHLAGKLTYIDRRLRDIAITPKSHHCDVVLMTSAPEVEMASLRRVTRDFTEEFNSQDELYYRVGQWDNSTGGKLQVVACCATNMGMTAMTVASLKAINRWRPKYICLCGITAATSGSLNFGDILVADSSYDYGSGKIIETKDAAGALSRSFLPSFFQLPIHAGTQVILQRCVQEQRYIQDIARDWPGDVPAPLKVQMGIIATGAAVVQSAEMVSQILENSRKVVGIDMETFAIFHSAHLSWNPKPKVIVAKSISDYADSAKSDDWQKYAAFTSSNYIKRLLTQTPCLWE